MNEMEPYFSIKLLILLQCIIIDCMLYSIRIVTHNSINQFYFAFGNLYITLCSWFILSYEEMRQKIGETQASASQNHANVKVHCEKVHCNQYM